MFSKPRMFFEEHEEREKHKKVSLPKLISFYLKITSFGLNYLRLLVRSPKRPIFMLKNMRFYP